MEDVVCTGITSFIVFSKARIMIMLFHVCKPCFGISIEMFFSLISVCHVASEPFIESHCTHDVVIRHRIKAVKCVFNFLFGSNSCLEAGGRSSWWVSFPIHDLFFLETPWLIGQHVNIFGLDELIFE